MRLLPIYLLMSEFQARRGWSLRTSTTISSATVLLVEAVREACSLTFLCLRPLSAGREKDGVKQGERKSETPL